MYDSEAAERTETATPLNRRRFLLTAGSLGVATLVAGCGGEGGPGVGTGSPNETTAQTDSPTAEQTDMETETETEAETETETETGSDARVRVGHLSPNAPNVDVYVDDSVVLEDVAFGTVSDYLALSAGTHAVEITAAGDPDTSVFQGDVTLEAGTDYTVAAIGEVGENADQPFEPVVLEDDNEPPGSDTARLRAVHASPDAPAVDITAGDTVLFDGVEFSGSGYTEVPAGDYTVEIRPDTEANDGEVVASFDVSLAGGTVYSAFAAGYLTPDDEPADTPFDLVVTQDAGGG